MSDRDEAGDDTAARLEAALDRIARVATLRPVEMPPTSGEPAPVTSEVISRLDRLIDRLRDAVEPSN